MRRAQSWWLAGAASGADADARAEAPAAAFDESACGTCEGEPGPDVCAVPVSYAEAWEAENIACPPPRQVCGYFDAAFATGPHAALWENCSIVVGMHPDQATEPIVRLALAAGKPFVVVPCCVFAKSNPQRALRDGTQVSTHPQFCDWLEELGAGVCGRAQLGGFEGRNLVVFAHGDAAAPRDVS